MTIGRQWAWKPKDELKSAAHSLNVLIRATGGDGNLLYNVGPMPDGRIEPRQVEVLRDMGGWLRQHGDTIYGTRGGPYTPTDWGATTRKGDRIYLHLLHWFGENPTLVLPDPGVAVKSCRLLTGGELKWRSEDGEIVIEIPEKARQAVDTIVELRVEGEALEIKPVAPRAQSLSFGKPATASSQTFFGTPEAAFNGDWVGHGWRPEASDSKPWLAVNLGDAVPLARAILFEDGDRIRGFEIESRPAGGQWKTIHRGERIGGRLEVPLTGSAAELRFRFSAAEGTPAIREIVLLGARR